MRTRIRHNRRAGSALVFGVVCGLVGCQHLERFRPGPSAHRDPGAKASQALSQPSEPGGKITPAQEADVQIAFARAAERRGDLDQAIAVYRDALARDGARADAYARLAILHDRQGRFRESAELYQKALHLQPGDPELFCDMGYSLYLQRRWAESEMILRQALAVSPGHRRAHNNLALVLAHSGRTEESLAEFRRAGGSRAEAEGNLAFALSMDRRWREARAHYKLALAADPSSTTIKARLQQLDALAARLEPAAPNAPRDEKVATAGSSASSRSPTRWAAAAPPRPPSRRPARPAPAAGSRPRPGADPCSSSTPAAPNPR